MLEARRGERARDNDQVHVRIRNDDRRITFDGYQRTPITGHIIVHERLFIHQTSRANTDRMLLEAKPKLLHQRRLGTKLTENLWRRISENRWIVLRGFDDFRMSMSILVHRCVSVVLQAYPDRSDPFRYRAIEGLIDVTMFDLRVTVLAKQGRRAVTLWLQWMEDKSKEEEREGKAYLVDRISTSESMSNSKGSSDWRRWSEDGEEHTDTDN